MQRSINLFVFFSFLSIASAITFTPLVHFDNCPSGTLSGPVQCKIIQWFRFTTSPAEPPITVNLVSHVTGEKDIIFDTVTTDTKHKLDFSRVITLCPAGTRGGPQTIIAQSIFTDGSGNPLAQSSASLQITCPSGVTRDPKFYGFDGEIYFVKGEVDKVYSLISEEHVEVNALFGQHGQYYQHQTFMQEIGVVIGDEYEISIDRDATVIVNDKHFECEEASLETELFTLDCSRDGRNSIFELVIPGYEFTFTAKENGTMVNLQVSLQKGVSFDREIHGLLGQTADRDEVPRKGQPHSQQGEGWIDGVYSDYEVADLFAFNFAYNRYQGERIPLDSE